MSDVRYSELSWAAITTEADAYDVAVMQALIEHEANQDG